jgi:hypothetical protein
MKGLNVLRPREYMVLLGSASGPVPPFDPIVLSTKGSLFVTRPTHSALHRNDGRVESASKRGIRNV